MCLISREISIDNLSTIINLQSKSSFIDRYKKLQSYFLSQQIMIEN